MGPITSRGHYPGPEKGIRWQDSSYLSGGHQWVVFTARLLLFTDIASKVEYYSMAEIIAVCKSEEKGTRKKAVAAGILKEDYGLDGDAHADCCTHRQVSLLAVGE